MQDRRTVEASEEGRQKVKEEGKEGRKEEREGR